MRDSREVRAECPGMFLRGRPRARRFPWQVASIAAHAAAVGGALWMARSPLVDGAIRVIVANPPAELGPLRPPRPEQAPAQRPAPPKVPEARAAPRPARVAARTPRHPGGAHGSAVARPLAAALAPATAPLTALVPGNPAAPVFAGERLAGLPGSDAPGARTGFEEGTSEDEISPWLREHYREIVRRIRARILDEQYYPWSIRMRWREGHVRVSFTVRNDGTPSDVRVATSSGHRDLDRCAIAAVRDAGPFPRPPRDEAVVVPITFVLM